jgi:hypothetical protein
MRYLARGAFHSKGPRSLLRTAPLFAATQPESRQLDVKESFE